MNYSGTVWPKRVALSDRNTQIATEKLSLKGFENEYKENFFEKSLLVKYLENINKEGRYFSLSSQQMADICKNRGEPDYYLKNNAGDVILFEHKDIKISGKIKQSGDLELIVSEYKNKLLRKKKSNKKDLNNPKPVGIGQLVTSVNKIGNGDFVWDTDLDHHAVIYPVIILTDSNFIPDGFPFQMNYWFQEELEKDNVVNINIMPLVVMTTSTLLLYSKHFIQNGIEYYHWKMLRPKLQGMVFWMQPI